MRLAVIGAGIQGCCLALELASRGVSVDLIDQASEPMAAASRHTEGKIHLGFVYANDPSLQTATLMARGATHFQPLLRRWLGDGADLGTSIPFTYAVHETSIVGVDELLATYDRIGDLIHRHDPGGGYFGIDDPGAVELRAGADRDPAFGKRIAATVATQEVAVDPDVVADLLAKAVVDAVDINVLCGHMVDRIDTVDRSIRVCDGETFGRYDHIVNCTWAGRLAIDASAGLPAPPRWTFRMKYFVRTRRPGSDPLPSTAVVLGPYGDIVDYGTGDLFLGWYPVGCTQWSHEVSPPVWPHRPEGATADEIARKTIDALAEEVLPGLEGLEAVPGPSLEVRGGYIYALGATDVDDRDSGFHQRHAVGPATVDGWYHTVDTGKYTLAPLFAVETADRILDGGRR